MCQAIQEQQQQQEQGLDLDLDLDVDVHVHVDDPRASQTNLCQHYNLFLLCFALFWLCCLQFNRSSCLVSSDGGGETQADFSEVFPDGDGEDEKSGDFYNTPASPITVPYCPRPPSTGKNDVLIAPKLINVHVPKRRKQEQWLVIRWAWIAAKSCQASRK